MPDLVSDISRRTLRLILFNIYVYNNLIGHRHDTNTNRMQTYPSGTWNWSEA